MCKLKVVLNPSQKYLPVLNIVDENYKTWNKFINENLKFYAVTCYQNKEVILFKVYYILRLCKTNLNLR